MTLMDHVLAVTGFDLKPIKRWPSPGVTVTKVEWDGCMATIRNEIDTGDLVEYSKQKVGDPIEGIYILYDKAGLRFEPLAHVRIVNGEMEIWS